MSFENEDFEKCVERKHGKGFYDILCRCGFWGVSTSNKEESEREAKHYWIQYYNDGEYRTHLLKTKTAAPHDECGGLTQP